MRNRRGTTGRPGAREFVLEAPARCVVVAEPAAVTHALLFHAGEITALRDPFDALICAAAVDLSLPLITRDAAIVDARRVKTVW